MAKYKVWDNQLNCYIFNECVFNTKKEVINQLVNYHEVDCWGDLTKIRQAYWKENEFMDLVIEKVI